MHIGSKAKDLEQGHFLSYVASPSSLSGSAFWATYAHVCCSSQSQCCVCTLNPEIPPLPPCYFHQLLVPGLAWSGLLQKRLPHRFPCLQATETCKLNLVSDPSGSSLPWDKVFQTSWVWTEATSCLDVCLLPNSESEVLRLLMSQHTVLLALPPSASLSAVLLPGNVTRPSELSSDATSVGNPSPALLLFPLLAVSADPQHLCTSSSLTDYVRWTWLFISLPTRLGDRPVPCPACSFGIYNQCMTQFCWTNVGQRDRNCCLCLGGSFYPLPSSVEIYLALQNLAPKSLLLHHLLGRDSYSLHFIVTFFIHASTTV